MRRSSGKNEFLDICAPAAVVLFLLASEEDGPLKMDLIAAAAVDEEVELRREEEEAAAAFADWSRVVRRSQRHDGQKPVKFSSG